MLYNDLYLFSAILARPNRSLDLRYAALSTLAGHPFPGLLTLSLCSALFAKNSCVRFVSDLSRAAHARGILLDKRLDYPPGS